MPRGSGSPFTGAPRQVPGSPRQVPGAPQRVPGGPARSGTKTDSRIHSGFGAFRTTAPDESTATEWRDVHTKQIRNFQGRFAGAWGIAWQGLDVISENMGKYVERVDRARERQMEKLRREMEQYMKDNHAWENETGNAERGLQAVLIHQPGRSTIWVGHGKDVPYGIWLEIMQNGQFAILLPTVLKFGPRVAGEVAAGV